MAERLAAVPGLRGTGDSEPVEPVDEALAMRVASKMAKPWRDAVRLQLLTGMRPGDCLAIHVDQIERREGYSIYRPQAKMAHCGRKCAIVLNKQAVELLDARGHVDGYFFPGRSKGHLAASSYAHAVARACVACGAEHWHPHQLRHTFATRLRAAGARVEDVQAALGHAALSTTEVYAERDLDRIAIIVARASGSL